MSVGASGWVVSVSFVGVWRTVLTSTGEGGGRAASAVAVASTAGASASSVGILGVVGASCSMT